MDLKAKLSQPGKRKLVELAVGDEKLSVELREINMAQKAQLQASAGGLVKDNEGRDVPKDPARFLSALLAVSAFDPSTGKRIFSSADEVLDAGPAIDDLLTATMGMITPAADELKSKSQATPS